ncbi:PilZ domain-containing protein [Lachnospiraceae bacterium]|jgi:hypothetical protein|nr:PilZ domain-containing protein [uncultured Schaedlerella sp.]EOS35233.1 hypothetical protein C808_05012 [Lachnospiraceae bacterium M18-1]MCI9154537.1 PilZ domain-containing protein [Ruminococcus sp.]NBI58726.1 PilZ domain-containing protein [Lachnospiraceae bacterium]
MISITSLQDTQSGSLFLMDCSFLSSVRYCCESPDTVCLIFSEKPEDLPERIFLMPDGRQYDYRAFIYTLSKDSETCRLQDGRTDGSETNVQGGSFNASAEKEYYVVRGVTDDIQEVRKNFRVYVSFRTSVYFDNDSKEAMVTIKDIGCGGFLFVSDQKYKPGDTLSVVLFDSRNPLLVKARIRKLRPVRKEGRYGYGCEYIDLNSQSEARIRNYVFQTEVLQMKAKES